jgi:hypothetical protein
VNEEKVRLSYDSSGNCLEELEQYWNVSYWENDRKFTFFYDENNYDTLRIRERWQGDTWVQNRKDVYYYENDHKILEKRYDWDGIDWGIDGR